MEVLGIDIGGSGIKGAPVDITTGELMADRCRIATPQPSTPDAVAEVVADVTRHFGWHGPIGITFPAVVQHGVVYTAANVDKSWIGTDAKSLFEASTDCPITVLNDADAAGVAEMALGAGREREGVVLLLTLGTGIGTAIFTDGHLVPNTELGHLEINGKDAELTAAARVRKDEKLSWQQWGQQVNEYLLRLEFYFSPDLFIIGGGVSKRKDKFFEYLTTRAEVIAAELQNEAGIIGAAMAASTLNWSE